LTIFQSTFEAHNNTPPLSENGLLPDNLSCKGIPVRSV
jgi:hypothetical protein